MKRGKSKEPFVVRTNSPIVSQAQEAPDEEEDLDEEDEE